MEDQKKTYTVCAAFMDGDSRATVEVEASSYANACAHAIKMIDAGQVETQVATWDPTPTFVYGVVEGAKDRSDPFLGAANVPWFFSEDRVDGGPARMAALLRRAFEAVVSMALSPDAPDAEALKALARDVDDAVGDHLEGRWARPEVVLEGVTSVGVMTRIGPMLVHFEGTKASRVVQFDVAGAPTEIWRDAGRDEAPPVVARAAIMAAAAKAKAEAAAR